MKVAVGRSLQHGDTENNETGHQIGDRPHHDADEAFKPHRVGPDGFDQRFVGSPEHARHAFCKNGVEPEKDAHEKQNLSAGPPYRLYGAEDKDSAENDTQ